MNIKRSLFLLLVLAVGLKASHGQTCPCEGGTADYLVDCDGDGVNDACSVDDCEPCTELNPTPDSTAGFDCDGDGTYDECELEDCPDISISGPSYVEVGEDITLTVAVGKSDYSWSVASGDSFVSTDGSTSDTVTITGDSAGVASIEVEDANGKTATYDVTCFSVEVTLASTSSVDGELDIDLNIEVEPSEVGDVISSVTFQATNAEGGSSFDNPDGEGLTFSKRGNDELEWKIDKARWYKDSGDDCTDFTDDEYLSCEYTIAGTYTLDGQSADLNDLAFTVVVNDGLDAGADVVHWHSHHGQDGAPTIADMIKLTRIDKLLKPSYYEGTVDVSDFKRLMKVSVDYGSTLSDSQFYDMIVAEENEHKAQLIENKGNLLPATEYFSVSQVIAEIKDIKETNEDKDVLTRLIASLITREITDENNETGAAMSSYGSSNELGCRLESAAKVAANSTYHLALSCAYTGCNN